jgi:hypothetical protein
MKLAIDGYFQPVPLPLPLIATDQNAALMIMTSAIKWQEPGNPIVAYWTRRQSWFARKIGLSTKNRRARLKACLTRVTDWMTKAGGDLMVFYSGEGPMPRGLIGFTGTKPEAPRVKRKFERSVRGSLNVAVKSRRSFPKRGRERSLDGDVNVAVETRKGDVHVGGNMNPYEVREDTAGAVKFTSQLEVKKESKTSSHPIRRSGFGLKKQNCTREELDEIAEARAGYTIWNYAGPDDDDKRTPYGVHPDPYAE